MGEKWQKYYGHMLTLSSFTKFAFTLFFVMLKNKGIKEIEFFVDYLQSRSYISSKSSWILTFLGYMDSDLHAENSVA